MRKAFAETVSVATIVIAIVLVGIAARGRLPGLSWEQQFELYLVLIGAMVGIILVASAIAIVHNWICKAGQPQTKNESTKDPAS